MESSKKHLIVNRKSKKSELIHQQSRPTLLKSVNLQYITLGCLDDGTNESSTKSLMFQVCTISFTLFIDIEHSKLLFCNSIKKKLKGFFARNFARNHEKKNNTWTIRCLVDDSFVPSSKQPSVLYCKLTDF